MEDTHRDNALVPYFVFEGIMARHERSIRRMIIALIVCVVLIFASNAIWLYAWMQYDYMDGETTTETVDVDGGSGGVANYVGNDGDITNGED